MMIFLSLQNIRKKKIQCKARPLGNAQKYGIIGHKKNYFLKIESSLNIIYCKYYFLAKKPSTFSGCMIDSTKV
jgi:hypothetical protein